MLRKILMAGAAVALVSYGAEVGAQEASIFIQIEAQPSLTRAEASLRQYATELENVNGFSLGGGWYAIALGPYDPVEAAQRLSSLRRARVIPQDSYMAASDEYGRQFWPVGATLAPAAPAVPEAEAPVEGVGVAEVTPEVLAPAQPAPEPEIIDETPAQARRAEASLNRAEREQLQIALEWAGFYNAAIDGAFGRGTRSAMAEWQRANGYEVSGVLTTLQRGALLDQYNAILDGLDMTLMDDSQAGIEVELPMGAVAFDRYESPFSIYEPRGNSGVQVLLISQPGDRDTLSGLYEIMQTLEIVPLNGERERRRDSFSLSGANARIVSTTEVTLRDGHIKGYSLIWPAGDEERRGRVLEMMRASFRTTDAVLDPATVSDGGQSLDLVSGLQIRKPVASVSGFFVDAGGAVVTSAAAVQGCGRITLDDIHGASVSAQDQALGVAMLRPDARLAPRGIAQFRADMPRLKSEIAVAGFPFGGVLSAPTLTFGSLEDVTGLAGEAEMKRLALAASDGDAGGPVLDAGGAVLGMLLPRDTGGRQLPQEVAFAADAEALLGFLNLAGLQGSRTQGEGAMAPEDLTERATDMTVKVSCWE